VGDDGPPYRYRAEVLEQLLVHGARPTSATRPDLVHEFVGDLYRYELRCLRDRLLRAEFPKKEYSTRVIRIRERYRLLALRPGEWLDQ
jgi:hypothetical protein